jgi:IS5 family transposase
MAEKKQAPRKSAAGRAKAGRAGRLTVRRNTAPYRAAAKEQATRVREAIEAALAEGRKTREEIEARIEKQWHNRDDGSARKAATKRGRAGRSKSRS